MTEHKPIPESIDNLISQDSGINESQMKGFQMELKQTITSLEAKVQSSKKTLVRLFVLYAILMTFGIAMSPVPADSNYGKIIMIGWVVVGWGTLLSFFVIATRYWVIHRPALENKRAELQIAMFEELQQQMAALKERLNGGNGTAEK